MMQIIPIKKLYLPVLFIIAVVFILIVLIVISAHRNLAREKALAFHFSYRHGLALIHSIEASVRTGMKSLMWQEVSLGSLMHETAKDDCLAYVYLFDGNGIIIHHSNPSKDGTSADWKPAIASENQVVIVLSVLMALGVAFLRGSLRGTNGDQQMHSQSNTKQIHKKFVM